jgi:hypothetical protein
MIKFVTQDITKDLTFNEVGVVVSSHLLRSSEAPPESPIAGSKP